MPNVLTLVREITWDRAASRLVSQPVVEYVILPVRSSRRLFAIRPCSGAISHRATRYESLRNATFLEKTHLGVLAPGTIKTLPVPSAAGGALDVLASFDLSSSPGPLERFGIAVRAPEDGPEDAGNFAEFTVGPADAQGVR